MAGDGMSEYQIVYYYKTKDGKRGANLHGKIRFEADNDGAASGVTGMLLAQETATKGYSGIWCWELRQDDRVVSQSPMGASAK